jgi:hypothetical protein
MTLRNMTAREILLFVVGIAITLLVFMTASSFYARDYRRAILLLVSASALALVFFRKRKIALAMIGLSWVLVNVGLTALFHPSFWGYTLTIGSAAGLYLIVLWSARRYPYLARKHWHKVFEGEEAMNAENVRIEAEARELVKRRPFGPWLFR